MKGLLTDSARRPSCLRWEIPEELNGAKDICPCFMDNSGWYCLAEQR